MEKTTETEETPDFTAMANAYREKHGCSWQAACLAIKRKYPEAREAFKGQHAANAKLRGALASAS